MDADDLRKDVTTGLQQALAETLHEVPTTPKRAQEHLGKTHALSDALQEVKDLEGGEESFAFKEEELKNLARYHERLGASPEGELSTAEEAYRLGLAEGCRLAAEVLRDSLDALEDA